MARQPQDIDRDGMKKRPANKGQCRACQQPAVAGLRHCAFHREEHRLKMREWRTARKAQGLCYRCSEPARPGGALCETHRKMVTRAERPPGSKPHTCELCKDECGSRYYCEAHKEEGYRREREARLTDFRIPTRCSYCHILGHNEKNCRALSVLSPIIENPRFKVKSVSRVKLKEAKEGDVFVWVFREKEARLPHSVEKKRAALTVRYGGQIKVVGPGLVTPVGAQGTFLCLGNTHGWRCISRDTVPSSEGVEAVKTLPIDEVFDCASVRTSHVFTNLELKTLGDLYKLGKEKLLKARNFGKRSMAEVEHILSTNSFPPLT